MSCHVHGVSRISPGKQKHLFAWVARPACRKMPGAVKVFEQILSARLQPDAVSYSVLMKVHSSPGDDSAAATDLESFPSGHRHG